MEWSIITAERGGAFKVKLFCAESESESHAESEAESESESESIISRNSYWTMPLRWKVEILQAMFEHIYSFTVS